MSDDPRAELTELVRAARAWVEWVRASGADVLAGEPHAASQLERAPVPETAKRAAPARLAPVAAAPRDESPVPHSVTHKPALGREERVRRLAALAEEVKSCTKCRLHEQRTQTVFARGSADAELVFVGEGPGFEEDRQGLPFVGPAGQLLDKMIAAMGYARDDVYICNATKCRPPDNRKPEPDEMAACKPYLQEQLEIVDPKVIVALGATGVQALNDITMGITRLRGTWRLYRGRVPLMPTFHPAYLLRSPEKKRDVWEDLKQVMRKLGKLDPAGAPRTPASAGTPRTPGGSDPTRSK